MFSENMLKIEWNTGPWKNYQSKGRTGTQHVLQIPENWDGEILKISKIAEETQKKTKNKTNKSNTTKQQKQH